MESPRWSPYFKVQDFIASTTPLLSFQVSIHRIQQSGYSYIWGEGHSSNHSKEYKDFFYICVCSNLLINIEILSLLIREKNLIFNVCLFLWCKYLQHGRSQAPNVNFNSSSNSANLIQSWWAVISHLYNSMVSRIYKTKFSTLIAKW